MDRPRGTTGNAMKRRPIRIFTAPMAGAVLCLTILFWPRPASAQPLVHVEHDWTFTIGEQLYGLREVVQTPGEFRSTQVWVGGRSYHTRLRAIAVVAIVIATSAGGIVAAVVFLQRFGADRCKRREGD